MKVLITGAGGQVARALLLSSPAEHSVCALGRVDLDIASAAQVEQALAAHQPDVIINTAAYTAVDRAEVEPEQAFLVNARGPQILAAAAAAKQIRLIHLSTDFVFDGAQGRPYLPTDQTGPLSVYGRSKLEGEQAILAALPENSLVLRTAWVYAAHGQNFLLTMLRLMREHKAVKVVVDQIGSPTSAYSLAGALWDIVARHELSGVHHWTDQGVASWYDFAVAIMEEAVARDLLPPDVRVTAIPSSEMPRPAQRPAFSVLDKTPTIAALGRGPRQWREELRVVLGQVNIA